MSIVKTPKIFWGKNIFFMDSVGPKSDMFCAVWSWYTLFAKGPRAALSNLMIKAFPNKPFFKSLLKTLWEKEKFLLFPQCFLWLWREPSASFIKLKIVICKVLKFGRVWNLLFGKGVNQFLTHYHTMPHFDALKIYSCGKHCGKRRNCL